MSPTRRTVLKVLAGAGAAAGVGALEGAAGARQRKEAPPDAVGMLYDSTLCIGCRACVTRCKEANGLPPDRAVIDGAPYDAPLDLNGTTKTVIKAYTENGRTHFVKAQCMHCIDPACVSACMLGALNKREYGVVTYQRDKCVGCRYCQVACAFNIPRFEWLSATPQIVKCEMCAHRFAEGKGPACAEACPRGAIVFGKLKDLRAEAARRIAQSPYRYQPDVYGDTEAGGTQVLHLAAVPFEKLGLPRIGSQPIPELGETIQHGIYKGFIAPAALYAVTAFVVLRNLRAGEAEDRAAAEKAAAERKEQRP